MKARIIFKQCGSLHAREYHVNWEISQDPHQMFRRPLRPASEPYLAAIGDSGTMLMRDLLAIDGILQVNIHPYDIQVHKGHAFDWEDIHARVSERLKLTAFNKLGAFPDQVDLVDADEKPVVEQVDEGDEALTQDISKVLD